MKLQLGYTPNADDAYMLFGLLCNKIDTAGLIFEPSPARITELNDSASRGILDITMVSSATYPIIQKKYALCQAGSTFGLSTGPVIVAREDLDQTNLTSATIAIPGATTTAYAMLQLFNPVLRTRVLPLDKLIPAVEAGLTDCALVIHEEFVTCKQLGLKIVADLGEWWEKKFALPMPVTNCVVRRDLPAELQSSICKVLQDSINYANTHREEAVEFAMQYASGADQSAIELFISEYVNDLSISMQDSGKNALSKFYKLAESELSYPSVCEKLFCSACK